MAITRRSRTSKNAKSVTTSETPFWQRIYNDYGALSKILIFIIYYIIGVLFYTKMEGWNVVDCVYFITVSCTTIGYGYFHPSYDTTRAFHIPYLLFGVTIVFGYCNEFAKFTLMGAQDELIERIVVFYGARLSAKKIRIGRMALSTLSVGISLVAGTLFYSGNEGWSILNSLYWCVCTMTTVGYGDFTIAHDSTRVFAIFYVYGCVLIFAVAFNNVLDEWIDDIVEQNAAHRKLFESSVDCEAWIDRLAGSIDQCGRDRFLLSTFKLLELTCTEDVCILFEEYFSQYDVGYKGYLTRSDLHRFVIDWDENRLRKVDCRGYEVVSHSEPVDNPLLEEDSNLKGIEMVPVKELPDC